MNEIWFWVDQAKLKKGDTGNKMLEHHLEESKESSTRLDLVSVDSFPNEKFVIQIFVKLPKIFMNFKNILLLILCKRSKLKNPKNVRQQRTL